MSEISDDDMRRIAALLRKIGGQNVTWGAQAHLEVWVAEARMEAERQAAHRVLIATWALVVATIGLVVATVGLILSK